MPELPEVENVRENLDRLVRGKTIEDVTVLWDRLISHMTANEFAANISGQTIQNVSRRGKYLVFHLSDWTLISHLRMEGKYLLVKSGEKIDSYTHIIFSLDSGQDLLYRDVRKFGRFELVRPEDVVAFFEQKRLGPEPNEDDFKMKTMQEQLARRKKAIKSVLLDQQLVAGIGNIYADEILFRARIHPQTPANHLTQKQIVALHDEIISVMSEAIKAGGTTIRSYKNAFGREGSYQNKLLVYGKAGQSCPRCQSQILKIKVAGRGTHFCPVCQPQFDGKEG